MSDSPDEKKVVLVGEQELFVDFRISKPDSRQAVLLVHGFPLDHQLWIHQIGELSKAHNVLAVDLPGCGQSGDMQHGTTLADLADLLADLLSELKIEKVTFCGLSMGGYIGWQFWKRHSAKLAGLICANTRSAADNEATRRARVLSAKAVERNGIEHAAETMLPKLFSASTIESQPEIVAKVDQMIRRTSIDAFIYGQLAMKDREDATSWLSEIDIPTLVIAGSDDTITPTSEMKTMADEIKNSVFVEIAGAGHLSPLENSQAFNQAVLDFLS